MGEPTAESAGVTAAPVTEARRLRLIDALRGVALLGILLMNIPGFAMPNYSSESYRSDPTNVNFWVSQVIQVVFEGKMRALFGMVFGAGVLLFVTKKVQTGKPVTGLFYRRMLWLILFGLIHAHLILWIGDILYQYGICGMLVYLFRNVNPRYLEAVGQMAFTNYITHSVICTLFFFGYGLNYYGELEFYQLYFVVLAIWMLQLVVSTLWLRYFNYGPLEWVWRSLTYWRRQPFRRAAPEQPT